MRHHAGLLVVAVAAAVAAIAYTGHGRARAAGATSPPAAAGRRRRQCVSRVPYAALFHRAAQRTGIPEALLVAVAEEESSLDAQALSPEAARGLMQVLPRTAASLNLDADRVDQNVLAGALYLRMMLRRFESLDLALAAYNAGPTAVERLHRAPTVEILQYVQDVTARWVALSGCRS